MTTAKPSMGVCRPDQHDFVPKRQKTMMVDVATVKDTPGQVMDISEVFCRKCGTVCFLTTQEPAEPSRIQLARSAN